MRFANRTNRTNRIATKLTTSILCFALMASAVCHVDLLFGQQQAADSSAVQQLINQLESSSYAERQAAAKGLLQLGKEGIPSLVHAALQGRPETAARSADLLSQLALQSDVNDMTRIARIMLLLSENGFQHLAVQAYSLRQRWQVSQIQNTISELSDLNVQVQQYGFDGGGGFGDPFGGGFGLGGAPPLVVRGMGGGTIRIVSEDDPFGQNPVAEIVEPPSAPSPPPVARLSKRQLIDKVDEIVVASLQENEASLEREFSESFQRMQAAAGQQIVEPMPGHVIIDAGGLVHAINQTSVPTHIVTIGPDLKDAGKAARLLRSLPNINSVMVNGLEIESDFCDLLKDLHCTVTLNTCDYELEDMVKLFQDRPDLALTAAGHDTFLGVQLVTDVVSDDAKQVCRVSEVVESSAAMDAGLLANDIISTVDGHAVSTFEQLIVAIGSFKPGDDVKLDILRDDESKEFVIKLRERLPEQ